MQLNYLAFAVPLFIGLMYLEYWLSVKKQQPVHQFNESVANINVGIAERLTDLLGSSLFYFVYQWIHQHAALFDIQSHWYTWVLLFLLTDLVWYWYHRFGHEVNLFWSAHVVHHQSQDFNYTVSARITIFQAIARGLFWCVLPLIGFSPAMITTLLLIHGTYPFFTHTQLVGKLGWLEYLLVTPSHHRVHHSSNPEYLDKNYGDVLIIWDKLFGSFAKETVQPVYGLTTPINSHSFLWQHFHFMLELSMAVKMARGWGNKLRVLLGKPDGIDPRIRGWFERKLLSKHTDRTSTPLLQNLVTIQTFLTLSVLFFTILFSFECDGNQLFFLFCFILLSVISTGAMMEQKKWVFHIEFSRLLLIGFFCCYTFPFYPVEILSLTLLAIVVLFYNTLDHRFQRSIYQVASSS